MCEFSVGQVAQAAGVSRGKILSVVGELGLDVKRTEGRQRRFTKEQARQVIERIESERETRNGDIRTAIMGRAR